MLSLRITGNSHTGALKHGAEALALFGEIDLRIAGIIYGTDQRQPFHELRDGGIYFKTRNKRLQRFTETMGKDHIDWRDGHIWGVCMQPHSEYIYTKPDATVRDTIGDDYCARDFMGDMKLVQAFAIFTPGPRRDNDEIKTSLATAREIDQAMREHAERDLNSIGIDVIRELPEAHENGFLKPEYCRPGSPPDHANAAYGAKMMERIIEYVKERYG